ncbi:MAG: hypothetical protein ABII71_04850 [Candidatus Micrarchaeota archaeon]
MLAFGEKFRLEIKQKAVFEDGLEVEILDIVNETIEAGPEGTGGSYPGGSGVTVVLLLGKVDESAKIELCRLSEGYASKAKADWKEYSVELLGASESAELLVRKR